MGLDLANFSTDRDMSSSDTLDIDVWEEIIDVTKWLWSVVYGL